MVSLFLFFEDQGAGAPAVCGEDSAVKCGGELGKGPKGETSESLSQKVQSRPLKGPRKNKTKKRHLPVLWWGKKLVKKKGKKLDAAICRRKGEGRVLEEGGGRLNSLPLVP